MQFSVFLRVVLVVDVTNEVAKNAVSAEAKVRKQRKEIFKVGNLVAQKIQPRLPNVTTLLHGGVDKQTVADLAGHGDTSFLERTYCHPQMERKLEAARVISGIIPNSVEDKSA